MCCYELDHGETVWGGVGGAVWWDVEWENFISNQYGNTIELKPISFTECGLRLAVLLLLIPSYIECLL